MPRGGQNYPPIFMTAVARVIGNEGGYINNPHDPGGATKYGISHKQFPDVDIENLTQADAVAIYYRDFWLPYPFLLLPDPIAVKLFDMSVDIGPSEAFTCLQRALRANQRAVKEDGIMGRSTLNAANACAANALLTALRSEAAAHYRIIAEKEMGRGEDSEFLKGWLTRAYQ